MRFYNLAAPAVSSKYAIHSTEKSFDTVFLSNHGIDTIYLCDTPLRRLRGVFFRKKFTEKHAVLIRKCSCVHSLGLRSSLTVVFLDAEDSVLSVQVLPPNRVRHHVRAHSVLEVKTGCPLLADIQVGNRLVFDDRTRFVLRQHQSGAQ